MSETFLAVCSNKPRPTVHSNKYKSGFYKTGKCLWGRDVFHAALNNRKTVCGKDRTEWLVIQPMLISKAIDQDDFCKRCAKGLKP